MTPRYTALEASGVGVLLPGRPAPILALVAQARTSQRVMARVEVPVLAQLVMADGVFCRVDPRFGWSVREVTVRG